LLRKIYLFYLYY